MSSILGPRPSLFHTPDTKVEKTEPNHHNTPVKSILQAQTNHLFKLLTLELLTLSPLPLTIELELLRLLCLLLSSGSVGCRPDALAKRFRMSVRLTTPASLPACAPGNADAETEGVLPRGRKGGFDCGRDAWWEGGWGAEGWERE